MPAATVVASAAIAAAEVVQAVFSSSSSIYQFRSARGRTGRDAQNVIAIAAGVCDGLQLGTNAKAL